MPIFIAIQPVHTSIWILQQIWSRKTSFFLNVDSIRGPHGFGNAFLKCNEISKNRLYLETEWHAKENDLFGFKKAATANFEHQHAQKEEKTVQKNIEKEVHSYSWKLRGHRVLHGVTLVSAEHCSRVGGCQQNPLVILSGLSYQGCMKSYSGQHLLAPYSGSFGSSSGHSSCF